MSKTTKAIAVATITILSAAAITVIAKITAECIQEAEDRRNERMCFAD